MNTATKEGELAILPSSYQRTHALALAAHKATTAFGGHLQEAVNDLVTLKKDNADLWKRIDLATTRHAEIEAVHEYYTKQMQNLRLIALVSCGAGLVSVVLAFASLIAR